MTKKGWWVSVARRVRALYKRDFSTSYFMRAFNSFLLYPIANEAGKLQLKSSVISSSQSSFSMAGSMGRRDSESE